MHNDGSTGHAEMSNPQRQAWTPALEAIAVKIKEARHHDP